MERTPIRKGDKVRFLPAFACESDLAASFEAMEDERPNGAVRIVDTASTLFLKPISTVRAETLEVVQETK